MATKQGINKKIVSGGVERAATGTGQARTGRVTTVKHSKAAVVEVVSEVPPVQKITAISAEAHHAAIAKIAYGYWQARGYQSGEPSEDWLRAEAEYRRQSR